MSKIKKPIYHLIRGLFITTPWLAQLFLANLCISALLPISTLFPKLAYNTASRIAATVWYSIQFIFTHINKAKITISGGGIIVGESAIVVANHVSWTDFYMVQALAIRAQMLGRCRWFAKQQLKWIPFLGWGLWAMGMPLVSRNWQQDRVQLDQIFGKILTQKRPIWLISYSEATRFTPTKYKETLKWCEAQGKSVPQHTLHPRTRGFVAMVKELRKSAHVKKVYDCTIAYAKGSKFQEAPTIWDTLSTPSLDDSWRFHIHVEVHALEQLPSSDNELAKWLENQWTKKGERLEILRRLLADGEPWNSRSLS